MQKSPVQSGLFAFFGLTILDVMRLQPAFRTHHLGFLELGPFNRRPEPPPCSMNSMPASSKARCRAATVESWAPKIPGFDSRRLIVGRETEDFSAKSRCSHRRSALAARISSLVRGEGTIGTLSIK